MKVCPGRQNFLLSARVKGMLFDPGCAHFLTLARVSRQNLTLAGKVFSFQPGCRQKNRPWPIRYLAPSQGLTPSITKIAPLTAFPLNWSRSTVPLQDSRPLPRLSFRRDRSVRSGKVSRRPRHPQLLPVRRPFSLCHRWPEDRP